MKRREFIALLGGAAAWPRTVVAQGMGTRRIGVLMELAADEPQARSNVAALQRGLHKLGWSQGSNLAIDYRWAPDDPVLVWKFAKELVELQPEVIVAHSSPVVQPCWGRPATFPLYLCRSPTPLARASSRASPIPVGTSPDLRISNRQ